jgi:hypothetical protein
MQCPNCGTKMQSESLSLVQAPTGWNEYTRTAFYLLKPIPSTHYYCDGCDSEWVWTRGTRGLVFLDGGSDVDEKFFEYRHNGRWRQNDV